MRSRALAAMSIFLLGAALSLAQSRAAERKEGSTGPNSDLVSSRAWDKQEIGRKLVSFIAVLRKRSDLNAAHVSRHFKVELKPIAGQAGVLGYSRSIGAGGRYWLEIEPRAGRDHALRLTTAIDGFTQANDSRICTFNYDHVASGLISRGYKAVDISGAPLIGSHTNFSNKFFSIYVAYYHGTDGSTRRKRCVGSVLIEPTEHGHG